ncbi:MAG: competence type IV pilus minor pilin ComGF [Limosilactobacillus sp.]
MKQFRGFTIIECVIALVITALTLLLAGWAMTALSASNRHSLDSSVDWYVFLKEMEADSHRFVLKRVDANRIRVNSWQSGTDLDYVLQQQHGNLYLTTSSRGGYMPLFSGVKTCTFKRLSGHRVLVEVTRENGKKLAGVIQFYPE